MTTLETLRHAYRIRLATAETELRTIADRIREGKLTGGEGAGLARYCVEIDVCSEALRALGVDVSHRRPSARVVHAPASRPGS